MAKSARPEPAADDAVSASTKGRATPTRKEQEAARKRPLVPTDRRLAAKQSRAQTNEARERQRIGMANGEERYLPQRDKGPQKRYVRDYIDARWSLGEFLLPLLLLTILSYFFESIAAYVLLGIWAVIAILIVEGLVVGFLLRRKLAAKFGADKVERGVRWYAFMRMIQMRVLRLPKPQVKRGQFPS
ncbi:MAG TPA: DUF3043 domain-containing protein [Pseudolysinimonas sp.]|jgi:hypothetical protein|nr:DUF3043 domain-containing protein [Pseudolysinimonas sp.]